MTGSESEVRAVGSMGKMNLEGTAFKREDSIGDFKLEETSTDAIFSFPERNMKCV